ncbi:hypothetical protein BOW52_10845, partial [Solemya elarraichensis gill symbiont]
QNFGLSPLLVPPEFIPEARPHFAFTPVILHISTFSLVEYSYRGEEGGNSNLYMVSIVSLKYILTEVKFQFNFNYNYHI